MQALHARAFAPEYRRLCTCPAHPAALAHAVAAAAAAAAAAGIVYRKLLFTYGKLLFARFACCRCRHKKKNLKSLCLSIFPIKSLYRGLSRDGCGCLLLLLLLLPGHLLLHTFALKEAQVLDNQFPSIFTIVCFLHVFTTQYAYYTFSTISSLACLPGN